MCVCVVRVANFTVEGLTFSWFGFTFRHIVLLLIVVLAIAVPVSASLVLSLLKIFQSTAQSKKTFRFTGYLTWFLLASRLSGHHLDTTSDRDLKLTGAERISHRHCLLPFTTHVDSALCNVSELCLDAFWIFQHNKILLLTINTRLILDTYRFGTTRTSVSICLYRHSLTDQDGDTYYTFSLYYTIVTGLDIVHTAILGAGVSGFFIDIIFPIALWLWGRLSL